MLSGFRQRPILLLNLSNFCLAEVATIRCKISIKHRIANKQLFRFKSKTFQNIYICICTYFFAISKTFSRIFFRDSFCLDLKVTRVNNILGHLLLLSFNSVKIVYRVFNILVHYISKPGVISHRVGLGYYWLFSDNFWRLKTL